ncbi:hypothetical protein ACR3K2_01050 [Cryptosporidium serpentis]
MVLRNNSKFKPFVWSTYNGFCNISLGYFLTIWSILSFNFIIIFQLLVLYQGKTITSLFYTKYPMLFSIYSLITCLYSISIIGMLLIRSRKLAIFCLLLIKIHLICIILAIGILINLLDNDDSYFNYCIFDISDHLLLKTNEYTLWYPNIGDINIWIQKCGLIYVENIKYCPKIIEDISLHNNQLSKFIELCIDKSTLNKEIIQLSIIVILHLNFMLFNIALGYCLLKIVYSLYCIYSVGGSGWEFQSAEQLLKYNESYLSDDNPIIPYRYTLNGKSFLRF